MSHPPHVLALSGLNGDSLPITGGKAANLGELIAAGLPLPDGFVITTHAYVDALDDAGIDPTSATDPAALRSAISRVAPPAPVRDAITAAYRDLGSGPVAVRSSGTAEDLPTAAFAGQHDTFLNVLGDTDLLDAVTSCWASLWSDRVVEYRRDRGFDGAEVTIAVVVQRMIDSEAAGVMFTANPVTGARGQTVIDASPGLGEAVVSGVVTPDHYVVTTKSGRVVESVRGRREVVIRSKADGGVKHTVEAPSPNPVLSRAQVRKLTGLGQRIQRHFDAPQDTEWCLADGELYMVQSRPITALPDPLPRIDFRRRVAARMIGEMLPMRPYPIDVSGWIDINLTGVGHFAGAMGIRFPRADDLLTETDGVVTAVTPPAPRPRPSAPFIIIRNAWRGESYSEERLLAHPMFIRFRSAVETGLNRDPARLSAAELATELTEALTLFNEVMRLRTRFMARCVLKVVRFGAFLVLLGRVRLATVLLTGIETKTSATNRALEELADLIRARPLLAALFTEVSVGDIPARLSDSPDGREFAERFKAFLDEYGHRESIMLMVSQPTWRDDPSIVLGMLKGMAATPPPVSGTSAVKAAEAKLFAHPLARPRFMRNLLTKRLAEARDFTQFREDTHYYCTMAMPVVRRILIEYGRRLVATGALDRPEDVFHLHLDELLACPITVADAHRVRDLVERRAALREQLADKPLLDPRYLRSNRSVADALVSGTSGSAGQATGVARLVTGPEEFDRLQPGDILVAPYTNPTWTPLFARAAGVVVDTGSAMSHAAIVAREYGIPAVLGAAGATSTIPDGATITVNGDQAAVHSVAESERVE